MQKLEEKKRIILFAGNIKQNKKKGHNSVAWKKNI